MPKQVTIIGAGLVGSLAAIVLSKHGHKVRLIERRPDMRKVEISAGRSINLALSRRGIHALQQVGLSQRILQRGLPMKGRMLHSLAGEQTFVPYGKDESEVINSISRAELNKILMDEAEQNAGVEIKFNLRCSAFDPGARELTLRDEVTDQEHLERAETILGADGSASAIREALARTEEFSYSKDDLEHGYKELTIPPGPRGSFQLAKDALHIWPRGKYMLIALPNLDGSFTCTLFFPLAGELSFATLDSEQAVAQFFEQQFPDAFPLIPALAHDFFANPTGKLATIRCTPWHLEDKACLLGDAAHAIVPFFGQGMNCGFEDCSVLNDCLEEFGQDWGKVFAEVSNRRKSNANAIADLSLANYLEMRDHVADPKFGLRKQVEFALEDRFPEVFIPKYSMVSFHRVPYSLALAKGLIQDEILAELCAGIDDIAQLDLHKAERLLARLRD